MSTTTAVKTFVAKTDVIADAVSKAARIAGNGSLASLANVRLAFANSRLTVSATDLDLGLTVKIPVTGRSSATAFVNASKLRAVLAAVDADEVTIDVDVAVVTVTAGSYKAKLRTDLDDGFVMPTPAEGSVPVNAVEFLAGAAATTFAASTDQDRPILMGVLFEKGDDDQLRMVATDSFRLAVAQTPVAAPSGPVIVPRAVLVELSRMVGDADEVDVAIGDEAITFTVGDRILTARLIAGEFPAYGKLIPSLKSCADEVVVDRLALMGAVKRSAIFADGDNAPVRLEADGDVLKVSAADSDSANEGSEPVTMAKAKGSLKSAFNSGYLLQGLASYDEDMVTISMVGDGKPALVHTGKLAERTYLLMPVRV